MTAPLLDLSHRLDHRTRLNGLAVLIGVGGLLGSVTTGWLVASGLWYVAAALLLAVPAFVVLHRRPLLAVGGWMAIAPLVTVTESGAVRRVFWLVHRGLPLGVLTMVVIGSLIGLRERSKVRLGWPEILAFGYLGATVVSLLYTGVDIPLSATHIYDRIFVPLVLYLLVRLLEPDEEALRKIVPVVIFVLIAEAFFGVLSWIVPGALPSAWLTHAGSRTTGTLRDPTLYGVTMLGGGLFLLHVALSGEWTAVQRRMMFAATATGFVMAVFTYTRSVWLATMVAVVGLVGIYPRFVRTLVAATAIALALALPSGIIQTQIELAQTRFRSEQSEESALSRLPVMLASVRMFEAKPVTGFGYENFDRFDQRFQSRVGDFYIPEKDHASHNVFLTILAEQGAIGITLFIGPFVYWIVRSFRARSSLPTEGLLGIRLLWILWLILLAQGIVYNFFRLQIAFGFGLLWITLGLIASLVTLSTRRQEELATVTE